MLGNVLASCCWVCCRNTEDTISLKVSKALKVSTWGKILQHPGDKRKPHWTFLILWYILYQSLSGWASPICSLDMCQALDVYNILVITDPDTFVTLEIRKKGKKLIRVSDLSDQTLTFTLFLQRMKKNGKLETENPSAMFLIKTYS